MTNHDRIDWDPDELLTSPDLATDLVCFEVCEQDLASGDERASLVALRGLGAV